MSKLLKKVQIGNPLINFGLHNEAQIYDLIQNDEQLATFYHKMLDMSEDRPLVEQTIYAMIGFSTGVNINAKQLIL